MNYKPLNKQQADEMSRPALIPDGIYMCQLIEFSHTDKYHNLRTDSNGGPMTHLTLKIWDMEGKERIVHTNLFWSENNKMSYRTRHFAESFEVIDMYDLGELYDKFGECLGKNGKCKIYTQKARPKNNGTDEMWPAKNEVSDFIKPPEKPHDVKINKEFEDDAIPF